MLLFTVMTAVIAQQKCISLKGSKMCPGLENFAILDSLEFNTVEQFDTYISRNLFQNKDFQFLFQSVYQCPGFQGTGGRYIASNQCALVIKINKLVNVSAPQCTSSYVDKTKSLAFCASSCEARAAGIQSVFQDSSICVPNPGPDAQSARSNATNPEQSAFVRYCEGIKKNPASLDAATCFRGIELEALQCGNWY